MDKKNLDNNGIKQELDFEDFDDWTNEDYVDFIGVLEEETKETDSWDDEMIDLLELGYLDD